MFVGLLFWVDQKHTGVECDRSSASQRRDIDIVEEVGLGCGGELEDESSTD